MKEQVEHPFGRLTLQYYFQQFARIENEIGINPDDNKISLVHSPAHDWGFRGMTDDEALLKWQSGVQP